MQIDRFKGGLISGTTLILIGVVLLLDNLSVIDSSVIWPVVPIGVGLAMIIRYYLK